MSDTSKPRERAIAREQSYVDSAYDALDRQRLGYEKRLAGVRTQSELESAGARTERDSFATHYEDNLRRIRNVENRLVLGRLDFQDGSLEHIGRIGLRDEDQEILLLDWRAPQAEPFYRATAAQPGPVVRRRHIQTRLRQVTGIEDELLDTETENSSDLELTGEGALMSAMSQARDGKMTDIVATIQAEQDRIIRADSTGVLVVQGGPGTGKTAVALHRAAYLLYAQRERLSRSGVLVIGPTPTFLRYIDQVLPSLGESDVVATTIGGLMPGVKVTGQDAPLANQIKSSLLWRDIAGRAITQLLEKPLERSKSFLIDSEKVTLRRRDVEAAQKKARRSELKHNESRDIYARALVENLARQVATAKELELEDNQWIVADVAANRDARREINLHWLPTSPVQLLEKILADPARLASVAPELSQTEREALYRPLGSVVTEADIAIIDEFAEHLGSFSTDFEKHQREAAQARDAELSDYVSETMSAMNLGGGIVDADLLAERVGATGPQSTLAERASSDRSWTYGHVVVDEAQELSPMQWEMLIRRCPTRSFTVVGDLDQRPVGSPAGGWKELLGRLAPQSHEEELTISYRTPGTVLRAASKTLGEAGFPVRSVRPARDISGSFTARPTEPKNLISSTISAVSDWARFLDGEYGPGGGTIAVITPEALTGQVKDSLVGSSALDEWSINTKGTDVSSRIHVIDSAQAKGLEFDVVILIEPREILVEGPGNLYVAMTRPTRQLHVIHSTPLPEGMEEAEN